jgi:hypothetical protein
LFWGNTGVETLIFNSMSKPPISDSDVSKGAEEEETPSPDKANNPNLSGQQGHRDQNELIKDSDSDFPEPGSNPEHSGE